MIDQYQNYQPTYQDYQNRGGAENSPFDTNASSGYGFGNNNDDGKMSPGMSDYGDDSRAEYQWMKSNGANGKFFWLHSEFGITEKFIVLSSFVAFLYF